MEIRQMRYFIATAQEMNITKAAEKLHIAQPPLSRSLMALEEELGAKLFVRGKRRISLTPEGMLFLRRCEQILSLIDKTEEEVGSMQRELHGTLYIGTVEGRGPIYTSDWIAGFEKRYPEVSYSVWDGNMDDIFSRLQRGLIDMALGMEPYDSELYEGIPVGQEPWVAVIPKTHPLAATKKKTVSLSELAHEKLIVSSRKFRTEEIRGWFREIGFEPDVRVVIAHQTNLFELVGRGVGIAIFPASVSESAQGRAAVIRKIVNPVFMASYVLLWRKGHTKSELTEKFISYVKETVGTRN